MLSVFVRLFFPFRREILSAVNKICCGFLFKFATVQLIFTRVWMHKSEMCMFCDECLQMIPIHRNAMKKKHQLQMFCFYQLLFHSMRQNILYILFMVN